MVKIVFHTNVDDYGIVCWPKYTNIIPRIGETVYVDDQMKDYYRNKKLPIRMEVVDISYSEKKDSLYTGYTNEYYTLVEVELWYKDVDWKFLKLKTN